jgi:hypothetical protein
MTDDFNLAKRICVNAEGKVFKNEMERINTLQQYYVTRNFWGIDLT